MPNQKSDSRTDILQAARIEFIAHGYEGARTQRIADQVGVTKAMIHYYFNTKKELFEDVFSTSAEQLFESITEELEGEAPLFKKIETLIEHCLQKADQESAVLGFVLTESQRKSDWLLPILNDQISISSSVLDRQIQEAADDYRISPIDANQLLLNIFSLCYYPAISSVVNQSLMGESQTQQLYENRKGIILDTILNWLTA